MANISKIKDNSTGIVYDIEDTVARTQAMPPSVKRALDEMLQNVVFKDTDIYTDELATFHAWATSINLISISAVYVQSITITNRDSLDDLKNDLVVTATYDDGTTAPITGYTLAGSLTSGTSTITVEYEDKSDSFTVNVTGVSVPSTYTEYDYMMVTSDQYSKAKSTWMRLKTYTDLNALSCDMKFKSLSSHYDGGAMIGHRSESGSAKSFAIYAGDNLVGYHLHGADGGAIGRTIPAMEDQIHVVRYKNTSQSPSTLTVDSTTIDITWVNNNVLNLDPVLFTNPIGEGTINIIAFNQVGYVKFYDLQGNLVGFYVPVVRTADNVIGMYEMVEQTFYTTSDSSVSTIGNSGCFYTVGNWS